MKKELLRIWSVSHHNGIHEDYRLDIITARTKDQVVRAVKRAHRTSKRVISSIHVLAEVGEAP